MKTLSQISLFLLVILTAAKGADPGKLFGVVFDDDKVVNGVRDVGEAPVAGVKVSLYTVDGESRTFVDEVVSTNSYIFDKLPLETYILVFQFPNTDITVETKPFYLTPEVPVVEYDVPVISQDYRGASLQQLGLKNPSAIYGAERSPPAP